MKKQEMITLLRSAGVDENAVTLATNAWEMGAEWQKSWQGLSEKDINELKFNLPDLYYWVDVVRATEKKLKEKNTWLDQ
jgi:hypothetical protein